MSLRLLPSPISICTTKKRVMFVLRSVRWAFIPSDGPSRSIVSPLPHAAFENPKKPALNPTAKSLQRVRSPKLPPTHHPSPSIASIASALSRPIAETAAYTVPVTRRHFLRRICALLSAVLRPHPPHPPPPSPSLRLPPPRSSRRQHDAASAPVACIPEGPDYRRGPRTHPLRSSRHAAASAPVACIAGSPPLHPVPSPKLRPIPTSPSPDAHPCRPLPRRTSSRTARRLVNKSIRNSKLMEIYTKLSLSVFLNLNTICCISP